MCFEPWLCCSCFRRDGSTEIPQFPLNFTCTLILSSPFPALHLLNMGTLSMKKLSFFLVLISLYSFSCSSTLNTVLDKFEKKTPHEAYADRGLDKSPEGRAWIAASKTALAAPVEVSLPYRQQGYFQPEKPRAMALQFSAKAGEKLNFAFRQKDGASLPVFADLFKQSDTETAVLSVDTSATTFSFDVDESGKFILRLQPELYRTGGYELSVSVAPTLGFPVAYSKARIESFWGDERDGGKRRHEGVDIFAPKLTPAIAAADGDVTGVREGGLGGKTVWLRPNGKSYTLYYAHLDQQLVQEGQHVQVGDTVGLVGNTGNAKYTPSHLHFGVYTFGGAINPLPFVDRTVKTAPAVADKNLTTLLQLKKAQKTADGVAMDAASQLVPLAADAKGYLVEAPGGALLHVPFSAVKRTEEPVQSSDNLAKAQAESAPKS